MTTPRLFIGVPTADGIMMAGFVAALAGMLASLHAAGIGTEFATVDGQDVGHQRALLVRRFLASTCTHFLSTDSDMTFPPDLAERLLAFDRAVVGTIYAKRALDIAALRRHAEHHAFREAFALSQDWNVRVLAGELRLEGGLCRVEAVPTGFLLVRREVLERIGAEPGRAGPFDEMWLADEVLEGDYAFCRRCRAIGETVWAYPAADMGHLGDWRGGGPFANVVRAAAGPPAHAAAPQAGATESWAASRSDA